LDGYWCNLHFQLYQHDNDGNRRNITTLITTDGQQCLDCAGGLARHTTASPDSGFQQHAKKSVRCLTHSSATEQSTAKQKNTNLLANQTKTVNQLNVDISLCPINPSPQHFCIDQ
jgi:hypothetical protein